MENGLTVVVLFLVPAREACGYRSVEIKDMVL